MFFYYILSIVTKTFCQSIFDSFAATTGNVFICSQYLGTLWTLCRFISGPTDVKVSILIRSMGPISDVDMHYSMDCYFRQYWRDTRLSFKGLKMTSNQLHINQLSLNVKMLEKIWKPDTYFHNGLDSYLHTITRPNKLFRISENGDITYSMR